MRSTCSFTAALSLLGRVLACVQTLIAARVCRSLVAAAAACVPHASAARCCQPSGPQQLLSRASTCTLGQVTGCSCVQEYRIHRMHCCRASNAQNAEAADEALLPMTAARGTHAGAPCWCRPHPQQLSPRLQLAQCHACVRGADWCALTPFLCPVSVPSSHCFARVSCRFCDTACGWCVLAQWIEPQVRDSAVVVAVAAGRLQRASESGQGGGDMGPDWYASAHISAFQALYSCPILPPCSCPLPWALPRHRHAHCCVPHRRLLDSSSVRRGGVCGLRRRLDGVHGDFPRLAAPPDKQALTVTPIHAARRLLHRVVLAGASESVPVSCESGARNILS